jgi:hypothetical protein
VRPAGPSALSARAACSQDICPSFGRPDRYRKKQQKKADKKEGRKKQEG